MNDFGIEDKVYQQICKDSGYFKGFVAAKLISIEKRLEQGEKTFHSLRKHINKNSWYIAIGLGGIAVIAFLIKQGIIPFK